MGGGDVPQSDVDFVLVTPSVCASRDIAIQALRDLRVSLMTTCAQSRDGRDDEVGCGPWQQLEVFDTASVPILRACTFEGLQCDVSVDQRGALALRDPLQNFLKGWPEAQALIRLVKVWIHGRRLPLASEGGLPSLAWSLIALRIAQERPFGTPVEVLVQEFFENLQRLTTSSLTLRQRRGGDKPSDGTCFEWRPRSDV